MSNDRVYLCAGCGADVPDQDIVDPSLCPRCEEQIRQADTAWIKKEPQEIHES